MIDVERFVAPDRAFVTNIIDGDTIETEQGSIRLIGIDAPERGECGYEEASEALKDLVHNKSVILIRDYLQDDRDRYGRLLRYISVSQHATDSLQLKDVGEILLSTGLVNIYPWFPFEMKDQYRSTYEAARKADMGLFRLCRVY
jgi:micrococcal nuclease